MRLYDKGKHNYEKTLEYTSGQMNEDLKVCQKCRICTDKNCPACVEQEAIIGDYIASQIIHRFYYSLLQMAKSFLHTDPRTGLGHDWHGYLEDLKALSGNTTNSAAMSFVNDMHALRAIRNRADYSTFNHYQDRIRSINLAKKIFGKLNEIIEKSGEPKC